MARTPTIHYSDNTPDLRTPGGIQGGGTRKTLCGELVSTGRATTPAFTYPDPTDLWSTDRSRTTCIECIRELRMQEPTMGEQREARQREYEAHKQEQQGKVVHAVFRFGQSRTVCQAPINALQMDLTEYTSIKDNVTCRYCEDVLAGLSGLWCVDNDCGLTTTNLDGSPSALPRVHRRTHDCRRSPEDVRNNELSVDRQDDDPELQVHRDDSEKQDALDQEWGDDIEPDHEGHKRVGRWPHDCDSCTFLGSSVQGGKDFDLYWCLTTGTPIARYGEHGDYYSGMGFVTIEPMLALAYLKAIHRGLVNFDLKDL